MKAKEKKSNAFTQKAAVNSKQLFGTQTQIKTGEAALKGKTRVEPRSLSVHSIKNDKTCNQSGLKAGKIDHAATMKDKDLTID